MVIDFTFSARLDSDEKTWEAIHAKALENGYEYKSLRRDDWDTIWPGFNCMMYQRTYSKLIDGRWRFLCIICKNDYKWNEAHQEAVIKHILND